MASVAPPPPKVHASDSHHHFARIFLLFFCSLVASLLTPLLIYLSIFLFLEHRNNFSGPDIMVSINILLYLTALSIFWTHAFISIFSKEKKIWNTGELIIQDLKIRKQKNQNLNPGVIQFKMPTLFIKIKIVFLFQHPKLKSCSFRVIMKQDTVLQNLYTGEKGTAKQRNKKIREQ